MIERLDSLHRRQAEAELVAATSLLAETAAPALAARDGPALEALTRRLHASAPQRRVTILDAEGVVLVDSADRAQRMGHHGLRPEIRAARGEEGFPSGPVLRRSATLGIVMLYDARALRDANGALTGFVRLAIPESEWIAYRGSLREAELQAGLAALLAAALVAALLARGIAQPIARLADFARGVMEGRAPAPPPVGGPRDVAALGRAMAGMTEQLQQRVERIARDQAALQAILGGMVEGVLAVDAQRRVVELNAAACTLLGVPRARAVGRPVWEVSRVPEVGDLLERCLAQGGPESADAVLPAEGGDRLLRLTATPIRTEGAGTQVGGILVLHDVTEMRRLETVRRDFVTNVSHELKTPLTVLRGYLEMLSAEPDLPPARRAHALARASENVERMVAMVADLLALARLEAGAATLRRTRFDLRTLLTEALAGLAGTAAARGVAVDVEAPPQPLTFEGDEPALAGAVANLLDNAIKYGPAGGRVRLALQRVDGEARVTVADQGPGIPPAEVERIFERFYRIDKDRSRTLGGTGLGLSIVRHAALTHGGTVEVRSARGGGSEFVLRLPLDPADAASSAPP